MFTKSFGLCTRTSYFHCSWLNCALSCKYTFYSVHKRKHKQFLQIEHNDKGKKNKRYELFWCVNRASPPPVSGFRGTLKKVISFVMRDSLFARVFTGNFLMIQPVVLLPVFPHSSPLKADFKKTAWKSLGNTCYRLQNQVINQVQINLLGLWKSI